MRLLALLVCVSGLVGCGQLVEVHSNRGEMELIEYREIVFAIHESLYEDGVVAGSTLTIREDQTIFAYATGDSVSIETLEREVLSRYQAEQGEHPFQIEAIEVVSAHSRGVRIDRSLAP